jgi:8-oxo-dGTP diphosphatase
MTATATPKQPVRRRARGSRHTEVSPDRPEAAQPAFAEPSPAGAPYAQTPLAETHRGRRRREEREQVAEAAADFAPLRTERLTLRPLRAADAADLHRLINNFDVAKMLELVRYPYHRDLADKWIAASVRNLAAGTAYHLAITGQEGDREVLVGTVGITLDRATRTGRLGYWVGQKYWGHGVATEAAARLTRWGFANLEIDRIAASVATDNLASAAVLRRIGFRETGGGHQYFASRGTDLPIWHFEATREDIFGRIEVEPADLGGAKPLLLVAACALVDVDGRVLLARRPEGKKMAGLWEFPGGKLNPGETPEQALIRELKEELDIDVAAACLAPFAFASHAYEEFHLLMPLFLCRRWKGTPHPREQQTLKWVSARRLGDYQMPPADKPLIPLLRDFL